MKMQLPAILKTTKGQIGAAALAGLLLIGVVLRRNPDDSAPAAAAVVGPPAGTTYGEVLPDQGGFGFPGGGGSSDGVVFDPSIPTGDFTMPADPPIINIEVLVPDTAIGETPGVSAPVSTPAATAPTPPKQKVLAGYIYHRTPGVGNGGHWDFRNTQGNIAHHVKEPGKGDRIIAGPPVSRPGKRPTAGKPPAKAPKQPPRPATPPPSQPNPSVRSGYIYHRTRGVGSGGHWDFRNSQGNIAHHVKAPGKGDTVLKGP